MTSARPTSATESGSSLPTPVKYDTGGRGEGDNYHGLGWQARYVGDVTGPAGQYPKGFKPSEARQCDMGVGCEEYGVCYAEAQGEPERCGRITVRRAEKWPTPVANEGRAARYTPETSYRHFAEGTHQVHLAQAVRDERMWPTPLVSDGKVSKNVEVLMGVEEGRYFDQLARSVRRQEMEEAGDYPLPVPHAEGVATSPPARRRIWSTPTVTQPKMPTETLRRRMADGTHDGNTSVPLVEALQREALKAHDASYSTPTALNGLRASSQSEHFPGKWQSPGHPEYGELSPEWVEWLMGWPTGWTAPEPIRESNFRQWEMDNGAASEYTGVLRGQWDYDPSDDPEGTGITKTVRPADKRQEAVRVSRIAALGNGQVSAVAAAAFVHLWNLDEPPEDEI